MRHEAGESAVKSDKDVVQAGLLVEALAAKRRQDDLADTLQEAAGRGPAWRDRLKQGATRLADGPREIVQAALA